METFARQLKLVDHPSYPVDRKRSLANLSPGGIDRPIRELVTGFARLPQCFTLQCCFGHFVHADQPDLHNLEPVPDHDVGEIQYRIAYFAVCIENSAPGRNLKDALQQITAIDPENVQFGSPDWFWERQVNSYALQVEPVRFKDRDWAMIGWQEALHVQLVRDRFFAELNDLLIELNGTARR